MSAENRLSVRGLLMADVNEKFANTRLRIMTDEVLAGFEVQDIKCRSCSGYGNCGYKSMFLDNGKPVSICMDMRRRRIVKRDGEGAGRFGCLLGRRE